MKRAWLLVVLGCAAPSKPELDMPQRHGKAQLPAAPEGRLPHTFEPASYAARLAVDPDRPSFAGTIAITGDLTEPTTVIWLHAERLTIHRATASRDGMQVALEAKLPTQSLLALRADTPLAPGRWTITVAYSGAWDREAAEGGFVQQSSHDRYVYSMFEPDYARRVFPCIDEPDRKVPWQLTLEAPSADVAASNAPIVRETTSGSTKLVEFAPTLPLPSYLIAFAVGPFAVVDAGRSQRGIPIRILTPRGGDASRAARLAPGLLDKLESWLRVPFPYPKLDLVAVPRTPDWWAAMENAGLITFNAAMLPDEESLRGTIAHELVHHWFGDLVTPAWWDDLWLNESFAYWLAGKVDQLDQPGELDWRGLTYGPAVVRGVVDPRDVIGGGRRDAIFLNWHRGVLILDMIQRYIGPERFRTALQAYLTSHAHRTATTQDLSRALDAAAGEDIASLLHTRDDRIVPVAPKLACSHDHAQLEVTAVAEPSLVCFAYDHDGTRRDRCVRAQPNAAIDLGTQHCPSWLLSKSGSALDVRGLDAILDHGWTALSERERADLALAVVTLPTLRARRWSVLERLATTRTPATLGWLARYLLDVDKSVAPSVRPDFEAWIRRLFGTRARPIRFSGAATYEQLALVQLVANAGDTSLQREAQTLFLGLGEVPQHVRDAVTATRVRVDPQAAADAFERLLTQRPPQPRLLAGAPNLVALIKSHVQLVALLSEPAKRYLVEAVCTAQERAELAALEPELGAKDTALLLAVVDVCIAERRQLEPELRAFFAGHPTP